MAIWRNLERNRKLINEAASCRPLIVFDTETTGLGKNAEIIELAAVKARFRNGLFLMESMLDIYIKPKSPVPEKVSKINGITNEFLNDKRSADEMFPVIREFFGDSPALCSYNSAFDERMLGNLYATEGSEFKPSFSIDFGKIVRDVFCCEKMKDMKLETVADAYGVSEGIRFHCALDDTRVLMRIMNATVKDMKNGALTGNETKAEVKSLNYSEGYRGRAVLYVNTSAGKMHYSFLDDKWLPNEKGFSLDGIRMDLVEKDVFRMTKATDYKELREICKEKGEGDPSC